MTKMDRCPICNVSVKPDNLLRHLSDIHPRHPDTLRLREELKAEPGRVAPRPGGVPIHVRGWHVALVILIVLGGTGAYYVTSSVTLCPGGSFPNVAGTNYVYHWHVSLLVHSGSAPVPIPANIGMSQSCTQPVHTHDGTGQIHIEPNVNRLYTVGDFFLVWKKLFGNPTQMIVNITDVTPSPSVILYDQAEIHLFYDSFA